jgi:hypothetical protein
MMAAKVCNDEGFDIDPSITNAAVDSDKRTAAAIRPLAVKRAQTAPEKSGRFRRCKKRLFRIDVHFGLACRCQTESDVARQVMTVAQ